MSFTFNQDHTECYLLVDQNKTYEYDRLKKELLEHNITFGIDDKKLIEICEKSVFRELSEDTILIAKGIKPRAGNNGSISFLVHEGIEIKRNEKGKVDFYNTGLIKTVYKNQKIAEIIPPTIGAEGYNVYGEKISGSLGREFALNSIINESIGISEDGNYLIALKNGYYHRSGNRIHILDRIEVNGNLNFSVGNINTTALIFITGDILSGFSCNTKSSVHVTGVIENAKMEVGENIICKSGIAKGSSPINAGKQLRAKYIAHRSNVSCLDLFIEKFIHFSHIISKNKVITPLIIGGEIYAKGNIIADVTGNQHYQKTVLRVGFTEEELERYEKCKHELNNAIKQFRKLYKTKMPFTIKVEKEIKAIEERIEGLPETMTTQISKILDTKKEQYKRIKDDLNPVIRQIISLNSIFKRLYRHRNRDDIFIHIREVAWPETYIVINSEASYRVTNRMRNAFFKCDKYGKLIVEHNKGNRKK